MFDASSRSIGILGAGLMGAGIAQVSVEKGIHTILKDMDNKGLSRGIDQVQKGVDTKVKRKRILPVEGEKIMSTLEPTIDYERFGSVDMVIEAVFEDLNIKHKVVKEVREAVNMECSSPLYPT